MAHTTRERISRIGEGTSRSQKVGMAVALTAAVAAVAGTYFLYGSKNAPKNRQKVKSWMLKARAEVLEKLEQSNIMTREEYEAFIDTLANRYARLKNSTQREILDFKREMKGYWPDIESSAKGTMKIAGKAAARAAAKDVARKVVTRVSKNAERKDEV